MKDNTGADVTSSASITWKLNDVADTTNADGNKYSVPSTAKAGDKITVSAKVGDVDATPAELTVKTAETEEESDYEISWTEETAAVIAKAFKTFEVTTSDGKAIANGDKVAEDTQLKINYELNDGYAITAFTYTIGDGAPKDYTTSGNNTAKITDDTVIDVTVEASIFDVAATDFDELVKVEWTKTAFAEGDGGNPTDTKDDVNNWALKFTLLGTPDWVIPDDDTDYEVTFKIVKNSDSSNVKTTTTTATIEKSLGNTTVAVTLTGDTVDSSLTYTVEITGIAATSGKVKVVYLDAASETTPKAELAGVTNAVTELAIGTTGDAKTPLYFDLATTTNAGVPTITTITQVNAAGEAENVASSTKTLTDAGSDSTKGAGTEIAAGTRRFYNDSTSAGINASTEISGLGPVIVTVDTSAMTTNYLVKYADKAGTATAFADTNATAIGTDTLKTYNSKAEAIAVKLAVDPNTMASTTLTKRVAVTPTIGSAAEKNYKVTYTDGTKDYVVYFAAGQTVATASKGDANVSNKFIVVMGSADLTLSVKSVEIMDALELKSATIGDAIPEGDVAGNGTFNTGDTITLVFSNDMVEQATVDGMAIEDEDAEGYVAPWDAGDLTSKIGLTAKTPANFVLSGVWTDTKTLVLTVTASGAITASEIGITRASCKDLNGFTLAPAAAANPTKAVLQIEKLDAGTALTESNIKLTFSDVDA